MDLWFFYSWLVIFNFFKSNKNPSCDYTIGFLGASNRLDGLPHDAVIRRDDEDNDVRDGRASGAHRGERSVTGRVEERDLLAGTQRHCGGQSETGSTDTHQSGVRL